MLYYAMATIYVLVCLLLLLVVLLQQGKGGDIASAFGGGSSQTAFGARGGATVLTRATTVLAVLFMGGALVLALVAMSWGASSEPFAPDRASRFWGAAHGAVLLAGTVTVCVGFLAGLMYLIQSISLKHGRRTADRLRLPSLESLERVNSRALAVSALLIGLGFN